MKPFNREQLLDAVGRVAAAATGSRHPLPVAGTHSGV
jgi:hypothetical protein